MGASHFSNISFLKDVWKSKGWNEVKYESENSCNEIPLQESKEVVEFTKVTEAITGTMFQSILDSIITKVLVEKINQDLDQVKEDNNLTQDFSNILRQRLVIKNRSFVLLDEVGEGFKEIKSPGQLGLVIFQLLNEAIEIMELRKRNINDEEITASDLFKISNVKDFPIDNWFNSR